MYGQGNYAPQLGQSPHRPPRPPSLQQQTNHPPASAGLFGQGPPVPSPAVIQPAGQQPHVVPPGVSAYQCAPTMRPPMAQPYLSNPMSSTGPPYLPPPPTGHENINVMQPYSTIQQNAQHHPQLAVQNAQYVSPSPLPLGHSGVLPPPPSQIQSMYRRPAHQPSPDNQQMIPPLPVSVLPPPPPMPLQTPSLLSPSTFHSVAPSTRGGSHTVSATSHLPPLPASPPPLPPPPPPSSAPRSSFLVSSSKPMSFDPSIPSHCDPRSYQASASESVEDKLMESQNRENIQINHGSDRELETKHVEASTSEGDLSLKKSIKLDLPPPPPPPPPRPTNEKTLRNIEILCQFISKNGPVFEDMARQKEAGNPEFKFLFGGEPGSEAAIAQKYYLWMKNKSCLEYKFPEWQRQSNLLLEKKHVENSPSVEPNNLEAASYPLSDSDMDMEDDIKQPIEDLAVSDQVSGLKQDSIPAGDGIEEQEKDNPLQTPQDSIPTVQLGPPIKLGGDDGGNPRRNFGSVIATESPFILLKEYASDGTSEDDSDARAEVDDRTATLQLKKAVAVASDDCMMRDSYESKATEVGPSESLTRDAWCKQPKDFDCTLALKTDANRVISAPNSLEKRSDEAIENILRIDANKQSASFGDFEGKGALKHSSSGVVSESANAQHESTKTAAPVKVDEFGRLVREGASETDSDDSNYNRRRGRRGRSRSASQSPPDKKRRSPRRRKERSSRSRSWSPRRRRSRSRSPKRRRSRSRSPFRRTLDVGNKNRRGRHQMRECFNYLKGKCYRGESCRYLHSDPDKYDRSRNYRSKHHPFETTKRSRDYDYFEEDKVITVKGSLEHEVDGEEMQQDEDKKRELSYKKEHTSGDFPSKSAIADEKDREESADGSKQYDLIGRHSDEMIIDRHKNATPEESTACLHRASDTKNVSENSESERPVSSMKDENAEHSQAGSLTQERSELTNQPQYLKASSPTSIGHISSVSSHQLSEVMPCQSRKSDEPMGQKDLLASDSSAINCSYHVSQLPPSLPLPLPPPPLPLPPASLHVAGVPHAAQPVQDYTSVPSEPKFPHWSAPMDNLPSFNVLLSNQHPHYPTPQNPSWSTLPAPQFCPPYMANPPIHGPFQQVSLPLGSDPPMQSSLKISPTDLPSHPQVGSLQEQTYPSIQVSHQSTPHVDVMHQAVGGLIPSSSLPYGNVPSQPASSLEGSNSNNVQSFTHGTLPSSEPSRSNLQNPPYLQEHPSCELYQAAGETTGGPSRYSADPRRNHTSHMSDIGCRIPTHYNPYASTFDQPLSSKFSSNVFRQEETSYGRKYENPFSFSHAPFEGQKASYGASHIIPSPNSSRAGGQTLPKSGGDQYDPLFDSIDPSAESLKKQSGPEDHAADNSDIMLRLRGCKPSDVKVNRKKKELGAVAAVTSLENDEFGETADVEVGVMESGSQSNPNDGAKVATSDVEIDQVKTEGKSKKSKDSRSMKLFKVELANFVKEMLKPSWRQGNMSKEAFKTIVKKTVEKVSGAMKGHRVPKSKAKISQYIDRSQQKLTRLVQGYVNKYAKA